DLPEYVYEYRAADLYIECNNKPWKKLRHLKLDDVRPRPKGHARAVLCMITSSPNLQRLTILVYLSLLISICSPFIKKCSLTVYKITIIPLIKYIFTIFLK
ncbi:hypothetical protein LINGRAHAP2_LOCUS32651, partial [Linum grandiflorum]